MLTGDPPFTASTAQGIVAKVMTEKPASIIARRDRVPATVEDAVLTALEKLPADRFASAAQFAVALSSDAPVPRTSGSARATKRPSTRLLVPVAGALMLLSAAAGWFYGTRGAASAPAGPLGTSILLPDSLPLEPLLPKQEGQVAFALSPDGSQLVFVARHGTTTQLFLRRLGEFTVRPLEGTDSASTPVFSPKGDAVAFVAGNALKRISLADGRISVVSSGASEAWGVAWGTDGRFVVSRYRAEQLLVLSAAGDSLSTVKCKPRCTFPDFLPDGKRLLVSIGTSIDVVDLARGTQRRLVRWQAPTATDALRGTMGRYDGDGQLVYVGPTGQLLAAPFDVQRAVVTGPSVLLAEGVRVETGRGAAQFTLAASGVLAFAPGPVAALGILVRSDRRGVLDTIPVPPAIYNSLDLTPDGNRLLTQGRAPTGEVALDVIDVPSGRTTPWLTRPKGLGRPQWAPDGRRIIYVDGDSVFIGDPGLSTPPEPLPVPSRRFADLLPDGERYQGFVGDTTIIARLDGTGQTFRMLRTNAGTGAVTRDGHWIIAQEQIGTGLALVARALNGSGRRQVVALGDQYSMTGAVPGTDEVIVADGDNGTESKQGFWSIRYDAAQPEPFSAPRLLFRATVADFPGRNYAVGKAGQLFVFKQHVTSAMPREVRLLQHWHTLLTARPAAGVTP